MNSIRVILWLCITLVTSRRFGKIKNSNENIPLKVNNNASEPKQINSTDCSNCFNLISNKTHPSIFNNATEDPTIKGNKTLDKNNTIHIGILNNHPHNINIYIQNPILVTIEKHLKNHKSDTSQILSNDKLEHEIITKAKPEKYNQIPEDRAFIENIHRRKHLKSREKEATQKDTTEEYFCECSMSFKMNMEIGRENAIPGYKKKFPSYCNGTIFQEEINCRGICREYLFDNNNNNNTLCSKSSTYHILHVYYLVKSCHINSRWKTIGSDPVDICCYGKNLVPCIFMRS